MNDEEYVKSVHPKAICLGPIEGHATKFVVSSSFNSSKIDGGGDTPIGAWAAARKRIEAKVKAGDAGEGEKA